MAKFSKEAHKSVLAGLYSCGQSYTIQVGGYNDQVIKSALADQPSTSDDVIRDMFAGHALQALILSQGYTGLEHKAAHDAYKFADSMMNARRGE